MTMDDGKFWRSAISDWPTALGFGLFFEWMVVMRHATHSFMGHGYGVWYGMWYVV